MALYSYKGIEPKIGEGVFIAPSADVVGNVSLDENASLWHQCVARGDINSITIGKNTNIQDLSMLHVTGANSLVIGSNVSVGHNVVLHGCKIGNSCLIGMGAIILDGAEISENSVVAAGSVVPPGKKYPAGSMIMGNPAVVKRALSTEERELFGNHYRNYLITKDEFLDSMVVQLIRKN